MKSQTKWLLLSAVLAFLTSYLLLQTLQSTVPRQAVAVPKVQVVTAAAEVGERTVLQPAMLKLVEVSQDHVHPEAIRSLEEAVQAVTRQRLVAGEVLLRPMIAQHKAADSLFAMKVPPGKRAASIANSEITGVGHLLVPGDRVDVLAAYNKEITGNQDVVKLVMHDIEVLAVGTQSRMEEPKPAVQTGGKEGTKEKKPEKEPPKTTVTLAVTPEQAESLLYAEVFGTVRLALRGIEDRGRAETPGVRNDNAAQVR